MAERSADWMDQAHRDLEHARSDIAGGFYEWACFSCHQAAEKAIKAVFQKLGAEAWGHALDELLHALERAHPVPEEIMEAAVEVDKGYIPTRYPNAHPSGAPHQKYTRREAERMVADAERIVRFCEGVLATI